LPEFWTYEDRRWFFFTNTLIESDNRAVDVVDGHVRLLYPGVFTKVAVGERPRGNFP
jgi:hypothetical protein